MVVSAYYVVCCTDGECFSYFFTKNTTLAIASNLKSKESLNPSPYYSAICVVHHFVHIHQHSCRRSSVHISSRVLWCFSI